MSVVSLSHDLKLEIKVPRVTNFLVVSCSHDLKDINTRTLCDSILVIVNDIGAWPWLRTCTTACVVRCPSLVPARRGATKTNARRKRAGVGTEQNPLNMPSKVKDEGLSLELAEEITRIAETKDVLEKWFPVQNSEERDWSLDAAFWKKTFEVAGVSGMKRTHFGGLSLWMHGSQFNRSSYGMITAKTISDDHARDLYNVLRSVEEEGSPWPGI